MSAYTPKNDWEGLSIAKWRVEEGKPSLRIDLRDGDVFHLRLPDATAFRAFVNSLLDAGIAAFPEIAREHDDFLNSEIPPASTGRKPS